MTLSYKIRFADNAVHQEPCLGNDRVIGRRCGLYEIFLSGSLAFTHLQINRAQEVLFPHGMTQRAGWGWPFHARPE